MEIEKLFKTCPFCGHKPKLSKTYLPVEITVSCVNEDCLIKPSYSVCVKCEDNGDDTFTPLFDCSYDKLLEGWNKRI